MADPSQGETPNEQQRERPLHNFTFPKWGYQKVLRSKKPTSSEADEGGSRRDDKKLDNQIGTTDEMIHTLLPDLNEEPDTMPPSLNDEGEKQRNQKVAEEEMNATRPWNLRSTKRAGRGGASSMYGMEEEMFYGGVPTRPTFSSTLTKEEIEADLIAMTGAKPLRKPKRRARIVQKRLNNLVPGSRLREAKPDMYEASNANRGNPGKE